MSQPPCGFAQEFPDAPRKPQLIGTQWPLTAPGYRARHQRLPRLRPRPALPELGLFCPASGRHPAARVVRAAHMVCPRIAPRKTEARLAPSLGRSSSRIVLPRRLECRTWHRCPPVDLLYRRLTAGLLLDPRREGGAEEALADAWGIIDWAHRLDGLVSACRGLSKKSEGVIDYLHASSLVENHRHAIQHLESTIPAVEASGRSPWGHIGWIVDLGDTFAVVCTVPGLGGGVDQTYRMPEVRPPRGPIDYVSLYSADGEVEIGLTGQHEALVRFIRRLEPAVASAKSGANGILRIALT